MADITLTASDGVALPVRAGDLYLPYRGNWTSHLIFAEAQDPLPSGRVTLSFHGLTLNGYILRIGTAEGQTAALIVGGRGGLWKVAPAKYYDHQISARLPLGEILDAVGETLSPTSTPAALAQALPSWPRRQVEAGTSLDSLADAVGALWRVLPDGSVFFGTDLFTPAPLKPDVDFTLLHTDPEWLMQEFAPLTAPGLFPGASFSAGELSGKVGRVHYEDDGESFTTRVWYLDPAGGSEDLVIAGLRAIIREELGAQPYLAQGGGVVVVQRGNGTLDVTMDDRRLPPLTSVPYLVPVPGAKLTIQPGARVQVSFAGGDPRQPFAQLYTGGTGTKPIARVGDHAGYLVYTLTPIPPSGTPCVTAITWSATPGVPPAVSVQIVITDGSPDISLP